MSEAKVGDDNKNQHPNKEITYQDVAAKLLKDKLLLTALELHTELVESGKELRVLRDYFSNPGNFEQQSPEVPTLISRSGSQVTLDSLDLTRYSEDGEKSVDERVAVLEFELRKARETISALRNNLTVATDCDTVTRTNQQGEMKPHEQRALNFLINEYLLTYGYKLTSITFADENESQDFEDWDDVGLNISKPAELLFVYREGLKQTRQNCLCACTQTDFEVKNEYAERNAVLTAEVNHLKSELNSTNTKMLDLINENMNLTEFLNTKDSDISSSIGVIQKPSSISSKTSNSESNSPEHFEIIDRSVSPIKSLSSVVITDDSISHNSSYENDWTRVTHDTLEETEKKVTTVNGDIESDFYNFFNTSRQLSHNFKKELLNFCLINLNDNIEQQTIENVTNKSLVHVVSHSLLRIIPNIILNKREEAIPLLVCATYLNANSKERDKLLEQLFNLKKKPSSEERNLILLGLITIAKNSGEELVENEILPQCWEQLTHKFVERRLLVVESCIAMIPYVTSPIRNSLLLSILQQMLEDKDDIVREMVVKALALVVALCDDVDKYWQFEELAMLTLRDSSEKVVTASLEVLFPVLAQWALSINRLQSDLIKKLLYNFNKGLKEGQLDNESQNKSEIIINIVSVINQLLPFIFCFVTNSDKILMDVEEDDKIELGSNILKMCTPLTNPKNFYIGKVNAGFLFYQFDRFLIENSKETWPELDWFLDMVLPDLINNLNHIDVTQQLLLKSIIQLQLNICEIFGKKFTQTKIYPMFQTHIQNLEQILSSFNQYSPCLSIIPVYLVSVLSYCDEFDELSKSLRRFICALPLCGTPLDCLEIAIKGLCQLNQQELVVSCLWEGVIHQRPLVRAAAAGLFASIVNLCNDILLTTKITPALVTLANDSDILVKTATVPALGSLITNCTVQEVHDKAYMQIQTYLSDPNYRENHALIRQLVVTLGNIVNSCKISFRDEVILTSLSSLSAYTYQMTNHTRKIDMALALLEAFSHVIYNPLSSGIISSILLPGLRYLEVIVNENSVLFPHQNSIHSIVKECEHRANLGTVQSPVDRSSSTLSQNVNQGVEDMKQKVSKMFQKPSIAKQNALPSFQGIFKKK